MSMSTHVEGIKPPDMKWIKMKDAYNACKKAGIDIPEDLKKFFDYREPDPKGVIIDLNENNGSSKYKSDDGAGYEIELSKLPKGIKIIRFINSW